jgi:dUTP pyrophosphatase
MSGDAVVLSNRKTLIEVAALTKQCGIKPTLVPTGIKCEMPEDMYLELSVRSSCPLKHWLILANGVGIIDADYYNNPDNEGHIFFQIINLSPFDIILKKGDAIGQGIFKKYYLTDDDAAIAERQGGFGSTDTIVDAFNETGNSHILTTDEWYQLGMNLFQPGEESVSACNPERRAFVVGSPKIFTTENHDVEYSGS